MTVGERIQSYRKLAGFSQERLAEVLGVSRQAVSKWELDSALPETEKLIALARTFKISVDELLGIGVEEATGDDTGGVPLDNSEKTNSGGDFHFDHKRGGIAGIVMRLIEKKGYIAGYILMGYGALEMLIMGVFVLAAKAMTSGFNNAAEGLFGGTGVPGMSDFSGMPGFSDMPGVSSVTGFVDSGFNAIMIVPIFGMLVGLAMIIGGIVVVVKFKPKGK